MKLLRIIVLAVGLGLPRIAAADLHTVTDFGDDGTGTLRGLVSSALPGDVVMVPAGTVALTTGAIAINKNLTIIGAGTALTIIDGNDTFGVFRVEPPAAVAIAAVTIRGGNATTGVHFLVGGGVDNRATLALSNVVIEDCVSQGGGGVFNSNEGKLTIEGSTIRNNSTVGTTAAGGGILNFGLMHINTSAISGNQTTGTSASANGGGIETGGTLEIANSTISGNAAVANLGGGVYQFGVGTMSLVNVTIANNIVNADRGHGPAWGGGIANGNPHENSVTAVNTIIAGNRAPGENLDPSPLDDPSPDCKGRLTSLGHNLIQSTTGCDLTPIGGAAGDILRRMPWMLPLGDYGGPTETHALTLFSPGIDAGDDAECPAIDQRGFPRPVDGDRRRGATCDIGAFEYPPRPR